MCEYGLMLSSWEEIAQYVGRDVKMVRGWAKQGLPVRHSAKGGVCISRTALNAWFLQRDERDDMEPEVETALGHIKELQRKWEAIASEVDNFSKAIEADQNHATDEEGNEST
jgi:hypothetical protein